MTDREVSSTVQTEWNRDRVTEKLRLTNTANHSTDETVDGRRQVLELGSDGNAKRDHFWTVSLSATPAELRTVTWSTLTYDTIKENVALIRG